MISKEKIKEKISEEKGSAPLQEFSLAKGREMESNGKTLGRLVVCLAAGFSLGWFLKPKNPKWPTRQLH